MVVLSTHTDLMDENEKKSLFEKIGLQCPILLSYDLPELNYQQCDQQERIMKHVRVLSSTAGSYVLENTNIPVSQPNRASLVSRVEDHLHCSVCSVTLPAYVCSHLLSIFNETSDEENEEIDLTDYERTTQSESRSEISYEVSNTHNSPTQHIYLNSSSSSLNESSDTLSSRRSRQIPVSIPTYPQRQQYEDDRRKREQEEQRKRDLEDQRKREQEEQRKRDLEERKREQERQKQYEADLKDFEKRKQEKLKKEEEFEKKKQEKTKKSQEEAERKEVETLKKQRKEEDWT
ncbi:Protein CBG24596, partial [Caenorhabditis briggsae]